MVTNANLTFIPWIQREGQNQISGGARGLSGYDHPAQLGAVRKSFDIGWVGVNAGVRFLASRLLHARGRSTARENRKK